MTTGDLQIILFTVGMAALSTAVILPLGIALAWLLARPDWPGKHWLETLVTLPLVLPPVATGLILLKLFGRRGWIGGFLERAFGIEIIFTWRAVVLALSVMSASACTTRAWSGEAPAPPRPMVRVKRSHSAR